MPELAPSTPGLTDEQREIQEVAPSRAARDRPVAAEVDEKDVHSPLDIVYKAAEVGLTHSCSPRTSAAASRTCSPAASSRRS